jgi:hypothetical protein
LFHDYRDASDENVVDLGSDYTRAPQGAK